MCYQIIIKWMPIILNNSFIKYKPHGNNENSLHKNKNKLLLFKN